MPDPLKEAFARVREDIRYLYEELEAVKQLLTELKEQTNQQTVQPTNQPTNQQTNPTPQHTIPTLQHSLEAHKSPNMSFSTGNEGVPTNQPTNQQTNQHPLISTANIEKSLNNNNLNSHYIDDKQKTTLLKAEKIDKIDHLHRVSEVLATLDELKKEVRLKFKRLTEQEMLVFGAIYQLEEQGFAVDYTLLAQKLSLTEISIRDYIRKILKKGIPLVKSKEDNKKVLLQIPSDLKKVASLTTINQLRSL